MINTIARKIALECLNKPEVFGFQAFECNKCGKIFDTEKGCKIHIKKTHKR